MVVDCNGEGRVGLRNCGSTQVAFGVAVKVEYMEGEGEVDGDCGDEYPAVVAGFDVFSGVAIVWCGDAR